MRHSKIACIILSFILIASYTFSQTWEWQHPYPQGAYWMNDIFFVDEYRGWVVGDNRTLMITEDGGQNWNLTKFPFEVDIYNVYFIDKDIGFVSTNDFGFYYTQDGGDHWTILDIGNIQVKDVHFLDAEVGFIVGYQYEVEERTEFILRTQDGGLSWSQQFVIQDNWIGKLCFVDESHGWACGENGLILYTENAGLDWQELPSGIDLNLRYISFDNAQNGWVAGMQGQYPKYESILYHTSNGGKSWTIDTIFDISLGCFEFADSNTRMIMGGKENESGDWIKVLYHTHDGGLNWQRDELIGVSIGYQGFLLDAHNWWMLGPYAATILHSRDGGISWHYQTDQLFTTSPLQDVFFINDQEGWTVGHGVVSKTINGGNSWQFVDPGFAGDWHTVFFVDAQHGWIVAGGYRPITHRTSSYDNLLVYHTSNGGEDWTELKIPSTRLDRIIFTDPRHGWVIGTNSGNAYSTDNGGQDWQKRTLEHITNNELYFIDSLTGWIIGDCRYGWFGCSIAKTTDGGAIWSYSNARLSNILQTVHFTDSLHGWVLAFAMDERIMYHTKDGGMSWQKHHIPGARAVLDLHFANERIGWAVDQRGEIWYTEDGGSSWSRQDSGNYPTLLSVYALDEANAWAVGRLGTILKYTAKSTTNVDELGTVVKSDISIYPNPTAGFLNIVIPGSTHSFYTEISNYLGQKLRSYEVVGPETRIDLPELPSGLYLLNVYNGAERYSKKFMVVGN